jgi:hypothetical protein
MCNDAEFQGVFPCSNIRRESLLWLGCSGVAHVGERAVYVPAADLLAIAWFPQGALQFFAKASDVARQLPQACADLVF